MRRQREGALSEEEQKAMKEEDKIVQERIKEAASTKTYIGFFNKGSIKLMEKTPPDVLYELGIRAYTGSRDVPKDDGKAVGLMQMALEQAVASKNEHEIDMAEYYLAITERSLLLKEKEAQGGDVTEEVMARLMLNDKMLESKAEKGLGQALYTFGKDLY